ncbi:MAG: hypothetical protein GX610_23675 [Rhodococcus sp.]|nr:hypothetical protein [Rhodococcus sp. (in: high G+C Gram-positive bacteria)]
MTNTTDGLLDIARGSAHARLRGLADRSKYFTENQLVHLDRLLGEFDRRTRAERAELKEEARLARIARQEDE